MAYAIDETTYVTTVFTDDMSGTPDNWTNNGATHSFGSGVMTTADDSVVASENIYKDITPPPGHSYYRFRWKHTAVTSTPVVFQMQQTDYASNSIGMYIDASTNTLNARNGAGWTSTGITLATNTNQEVEFVVDRGAGTYKLYYNGSLVNTYTIDQNNNNNFTRVVIGGGSSGATWTYVFDEMLIKHGLKTSLTADNGSFTLSGQTATLLKGKLLVAVFGSFALTGQDSLFRRTVNFVLENASFVVSGQTAITRFGHNLVAIFGSYALNGQDAITRLGKGLVAVFGSFALTGQTMTLTYGRRLVADFGSFTVTGFGAIFPIFWRTVSKNLESFNNAAKTLATWVNPNKTNF